MQKTFASLYIPSIIMPFFSTGKKGSRRFIRGRARKRKRRGPKITKLLKDKTTAHLRYVDTVSVDAGAAAIVSHVFSANGLHDPDVTGTGHQPLMYDEYKLLYGQYRVISSTCKITPVGQTTASAVPSLYGVFLEADGVLDYSLGTSIIEDQRVKGRWAMSGGANSGLSNFTRSASFNAKRYLSPEGALNAVDVTSMPSTNGFDAFYQVWSASINGNNPGAVTFLVQLDYIVEFTDPIEITPS